jgi:2-polyprenyl-3-methyl-5-hydroxy-6-metoxy-1,4-benzoquinol methylase
MSRILENEIITNLEEVKAYSDFDKSDMVRLFINKLTSNFPNIDALKIADIGCGSGDYYGALCEKFPNSNFTGYDASQPMLDVAKTKINPLKVALINKNIDTDDFDGYLYDGIISSMFLHQLPDPFKFWNLLKKISNPNAFYMALDLARVEDSDACNSIVANYVPEDNIIFSRLFKESLQAAFLPEELEAQLNEANIQGTVESIELPGNFKLICVYGTI